MGIFDDMADQESSGSGKFWEEGAYVGVLTRCQLRNSRETGEPLIIVEVVVKEVTQAFDVREAPDWYPTNKDGSVKMLPASNTPGTVCTQVSKPQTQTPALGNLKDLLRCVSGMTDSEIVAAYAPEGSDTTNTLVQREAWRVFATECTEGEGRALKGSVIALHAQLIQTKKRGTPFTQITWQAPTIEQLAKYGEGAAPEVAPEVAPEAAAEGAAA